MLTEVRNEGGKMKKPIGSIALAWMAALSLGSLSQANELSTSALSLQAIQGTIDSITPENLINWNVGDTMQYDMKMGLLGKIGTMEKVVTKEEGNAIWLTQTTDMKVKKDVAELLISREDGKILKFIHNGKEEKIPDDKFEIISQDYTEVTVPKGTFKALHVVGKTKQISKVEIWLNPTATVMDGTIKQLIASQFGDVVFELTAFKPEK
jgi:hypothetical protein